MLDIVRQLSTQQCVRMCILCIHKLSIQADYPFSEILEPEAFQIWDFFFSDFGIVACQSSKCFKFWNISDTQNRDA